jgi:hypothetical protein
MIFKISNQAYKEVVKSYIDRLNIEKEKIYIVNIGLHRTTRTLDQNSLYWLWIKCIEGETGQNRTELHEFFKGYFLGEKKIRVSGKEITTTNTTTDLDTKQFTDYMEKVKVFAAAELEIILPLPEDQYFDQFVEHYKYQL